jgi:hypothetical protein
VQFLPCWQLVFFAHFFPFLAPFVAPNYIFLQLSLFFLQILKTLPKYYIKNFLLFCYIMLLMEFE